MVASSYISYKGQLQMKLKEHTVALAEDKGAVHTGAIQSTAPKIFN